MKLFNFTKSIAAIAVAALFFTSCEKRVEVDPIGDRGQTLIKIIGAGADTMPGNKSFAIDFVNTSKTLMVVDIRRDVANNDDLMTTATVVIKDDTAAVTRAGYTQFNPAWYTVSGDGVVKTGGIGGTYTVTFQPGEFAKQIYVTIPDATVLDPSANYGLGFTILSTTAGTVSSNKSILVTIGAKNAYDGHYSLNFCNYHPAGNPGYTCDVTEVDLITTGANTVKMYWPDAGGYFIPITYGGSISYFGGQTLGLTIDPVTNKVVAQNVDPTAATFYTMSPTFNSYYDPTTRTFYLKFGYSYVGGVFTPGTSREWTLTLTYLRSR